VKPGLRENTGLKEKPKGNSARERGGSDSMTKNAERVLQKRGTGKQLLMGKDV